ncbi:MAG: amylo-alpha-1,6-glucosidase [Acidobacteria bacterium]|nr:amylo-alpha-1,6-glucosidase [Acidobacteriota bacterium]
MADAVRLDEQFAIITEAERSASPPRVLKHGDTFGVFDLRGDIVAMESGEQGLYHAGTRFLSRFELLLGRCRPLLLSSTISEDNTILAVDLTNPDVVRDNRVVVPRGALHVFRARLLWDGHCLERIRLSNHALHAIQFPIALRFDSDFADVFEVRGTRRTHRGRRHDDVLTRDGALLRYEGLDHVERRTRVRWTAAADRAETDALVFSVSLNSHETTEIEISITCETGSETPGDVRYDDALAGLKRNLAAREQRECRVVSSNESFNRWIRRSAADLRMMMTDTPSGPYPYAGIPWFSTPFGRDGILTAIEMLWAAPEVAHGVLAFLADTQATSVSDEQDAQPGKILHEMRGGEMAALGEIPFGRYYGSVDATPLFVMLAHAYFERTADRAFIDLLWPHIVAALDWMRTFGDPDGDGFIEYARRSDSGLLQQGWKDSYDSVFHADGALAEAPVALCEVQGYAYGAWSGAAKLAEMRGDKASAREWRSRASHLRGQFEKAFWCAELGSYALALDGQKRPCRVRTSNPGHCLFSGIVSSEHARRVADTLMTDAMFAGWGVRTVAAGEARYNPMSYHNGSIWPHDNAVAAAGLARYGFTAEAARIMNAMFDLSQSVDGHRLPELLCGFHRRGGEYPTLYPVACAPQAWAAGAVYLLLGGCLGLQIDAAARRVSFHRAILPDNIEWVRLTNLVVAGASADLMLMRHARDVGITVLGREGELEIVAVK